MSDGDDDVEAEAELEAVSFEEALAAVTTPIESESPDGDAIGEAVDAVESAVDAATTEADLDAVDAALDELEAALDDAELPEPDDEDEEAPREVLAGRIDDARALVDDHRGPYSSDVVEAVDAAAADIGETRWTDRGETELVEPVETFYEVVNDQLGTDLALEDRTPAGISATLTAASEAVGAATLDPDDDAATVESLVEAAGSLTEEVESAQSWDDLSTREKLDAEGFYDVLGHRKDYPPEWGALKEWEKRGNAEMVLLALDHLGSDFMEQHCLEALRRLGDEAALEAMLERADRRDQDAIEILGKIGSDDAVDTIVEYVGTASDPALQQTTLKSLGEIGSESATQAVADQVVAENPLVRSAAARALGCIGDPRSIEPLVDLLADDGAPPVRGAAAWALVQIGTEDALEAVAAYADDRATLVQTEAETAAAALGAKPV